MVFTFYKILIYTGQAIKFYTGLFFAKSACSLHVCTISSLFKFQRIRRRHVCGRTKFDNASLLKFLRCSHDMSAKLLPAIAKTAKQLTK